jgi:hypothetical protein
MNSAVRRSLIFPPVSLRDRMRIALRRNEQIVRRVERRIDPRDRCKHAKDRSANVGPTTFIGSNGESYRDGFIASDLQLLSRRHDALFNRLTAPPKLHEETVSARHPFQDSMETDGPNFVVSVKLPL